MPADDGLLQQAVTKILDLLEAGGELSALERTVYLAWFFDAEVRNGGFDQFFFNSQGNHAAGTLDALRDIGALKARALLQKAMALFGPEGPSPDRDLRWDQMDDIPNRADWNAMDTEYYNSGERMADLLSDFLNARGVRYP
jgi:hypothetical protein